ncbi:histone chaperone ASF1 [Angomonas deanei]|uniref:ASF1 like histone chaperone, putative n=1 Tax=Angomonas deanei TaxID=59799 RepID=S9VL15_9TRYP|nr:histone chaperone ASF1 [Angomonas deanei]EPY41898.1 histone chaperone ASF1 [Angomonas deanei]CAD2212646.1 ASF1 like histone chaperone, putative [Angomonas deanei]|eukprot:EPY41534.1 histone chaperone ASF1 [Angomonas deanei]
MSTRVGLSKVTVVEPNPAGFSEALTLKVVIEIFEKVPNDAIDVKFVWSPIWDFSIDQVLDELEVGPFLTTGKHEFVLQSDPPDVSKIPDPTGPTALLVSFTYHGEEFLHIGFNVVVTCTGEIPEVFTSAELLTRTIGRYHSKFTSIRWDTPEEGEKTSPVASEGDEKSASSAEPEEKRVKLE